MMDEVIILLPPVDPKLHAHNKGRWASKSAPTKHLRERAFLAARDAAGDARWERANIEYHFYFKDRRRRDAANAIQSTKPAVDGVVDAGLIPDDDWQHLRIVGVFCDVDKHDPRVELHLTPWERDTDLETIFRYGDAQLIHRVETGDLSVSEAAASIRVEREGEVG